MDWLGLRKTLHTKQLEFVENGDVGKAGRGAGKSTGGGAKFHRPWSANAFRSSVFVTASAERARDIMMPALDKISEVTGVRIREYGKARAAIWPNGYRLLFRGAKDVNECNKRRGTGWVRAGWDECDAIAPNLLQYDVEECVEPRLVDFAGEMFFMGTPGAVPVGYWHDISNGKNPSVRMVEWDARDNPHLKNVEQYFFKALRRMLGIDPRETILDGLVRTLCKGECPPTVKHARDFFRPELQPLLPAAFRREYLGQWVDDKKALCYQLGPGNSYVGPIPFGSDPGCMVTIALDLGGASVENPHLDHCAWAVCISHPMSPDIYVPMCAKASDMTPTRLGIEALKLIEKYRIPGQPDPLVLVDSAGAGKLVEMQFQKMGMAVRCHIKGPKKQRIQLVQHAIGAGEMKFAYSETADLRNEAAVLTWNDTHTDHHPRLPDDCWDSLLGAAIPHLTEFDPQEDQFELSDTERLAEQEQEDYDAAFEESAAELDDMDI